MKLTHLPKKQKDFHDVLGPGYAEMTLLIMIACDPKDSVLYDLKHKVNDMHRLTKEGAYKALEQKHGFIEKTPAGDYRSTPAGVRFLQNYTQRKDIRPITNQVTISD